MEGRRNPYIAQEGIPFLLVSLLLCWLAYQNMGALWLGAAIGLFVVLSMIFHDPRRQIPAVPLGVISPVDGKVVAVDLVDKGVLQGEAQRIVIRISSLGTYTARCPIEGKILDLNSVNSERGIDYRTNALWVQTDEGDDVVLQFRGYRFGFAPKSFVRFGERLGQGSRCAYLRLARLAEVHVSIDTKILVEPGQTVVAGRDLLGKLPHS